MKNHKLMIVVMMVVILVIASGCASIQAKFTSTPPGATIKLEDDVLGTTPCTADIQKKRNYSGPTTLSGSFDMTPDGMDEAFAKIKHMRRRANYIFTATKEGYKEATEEFSVNNELPPLIDFQLEPLQTSPKK
jgi:maltose-binding protein MalE